VVPKVLVINGKDPVDDFGRPGGGEHRMERRRNLPDVEKRGTRASTGGGIEG
jgi:hypothetical protein